ncbi:MAG TPA: hypothetical protein VMH00_10075 [Candidatus Limnocylindrales bacterium]|nr:hypothetical protein [Candidatus Limnocylindrales bacterium]
MNFPETLRPKVDRAQRIALILGLVGLLLCIPFGLHSREQFFHSYLFANVFWLAIPIGCVAILMMHHLTGGWWGYPIRRLLEAGGRTIWLMALLFIPLFFGLSHLYPWVGHKRPYMNPGFFTVRAVIYFAIWLLLAFLLNRWSREQDDTGNRAVAGRMEAMSAPGLILWGIAVTYSSVDWVMSIESHWFSTIYGMLFMVVAALTAMCFIVFILRMLSDVEPLKDCVTPAQYNDLGNLILAFLMLWAYLSFSQFLIIWQGNLKDEIPWYLTRAYGGWGGIAVVLMILNFGIPFLLLLQRPVKRKLRTLSILAAAIVFMSMIDVYWLIVPGFPDEAHGPYFHPLDFFAIIGVGGLWIAAFLWEVKKMPLLPQHDPRFEGELEHEHGD